MREAEALGGERGDEDTLIVDCHDRVEGRPLGEGDDGLGRGLRAAQVHAQRPVSHDPGERLSPLGGDHHLDAERRRRVEEVRRPVRRRGQQKQQAGHRYPSWEPSRDGRALERGVIHDRR